MNLPVTYIGAGHILRERLDSQSMPNNRVENGWLSTRDFEIMTYTVNEGTKVNIANKNRLLKRFVVQSI